MVYSLTQLMYIYYTYRLTYTYKLLLSHFWWKIQWKSILKCINYKCSDTYNIHMNIYINIKFKSMSK